MADALSEASARQSENRYLIEFFMIFMGMGIYTPLIIEMPVRLAYFSRYTMLFSKLRTSSLKNNIYLLNQLLKSPKESI